jgi:hypothetical protein
VVRVATSGLLRSIAGGTARPRAKIDSKAGPDGDGPGIRKVGEICEERVHPPLQRVTLWEKPFVDAGPECSVDLEGRRCEPERKGELSRGLIDADRGARCFCESGSQSQDVRHHDDREDRVGSGGADDRVNVEIPITEHCDEKPKRKSHAR